MDLRSASGLMYHRHMTTYKKTDIGITAMRYCEGCDDTVPMILDRRDEYTRFVYFWACHMFSEDGDWDGERFVDASNWEHTEDA